MKKILLVNLSVLFSGILYAQQPFISVNTAIPAKWIGEAPILHMANDIVKPTVMPATLLKYLASSRPKMRPARIYTPRPGEYHMLSDRRLQANIKSLPFILDRIMQLEVVEYEMKYYNPGHKRTFGFIAQDVRKLFPELVTITAGTTKGYEGISDIQGLKYSGFATLAIKAIQEQQQMILQLKEELTGLKKLLMRINTQQQVYANTKQK